MIEAAKRGRAIVLTTHSMEEADILGDRIAIMARGRIRCIGTPIRLKTRFGAGYVVNVSVRTEHSTQDPGHLAEEEQRRTQVKRFFKEVNYYWNHVGLVSIRMDGITVSPCVCLHS
jgi:ABC-type multidrug transport system ATPase subunit